MITLRQTHIVTIIDDHSALLMRPNRSEQLSSVSVCHVQVFAGFSGHSKSVHKKYIYIYDWKDRFVVNLTVW